MHENIQKRRHAITLVVLSLLLITPLLASAQVPNPRSGREIVERVFQRLCERGILRSSLCNPTPPPSTTLTLTKTVVNDNGGVATDTAWTLSANGPTPLSGVEGATSTTNASIMPGAYDLSESGPSGYSSSGWSCTGGNQIDSNTVVIGAGQSVTCNITNNDDPPTPTYIVTIHKYVGGVHANATNAEGQAFPIETTWMAANLNGGATTTATSSLSASAYMMQTSALSSGANYTTQELTNSASVGASCAEGKPFALMGYTFGSTEAEAAGMVPDSQAPFLGSITSDTHVIIWNEDCTPTLRVTKMVVNDNGGTATTSDFALFIDGATTTSGTSMHVQAGSHLVTESASSTYTATFGGACDQDGMVTLAAGEHEECTITNDDVPPPMPGHLIVDKVTQPSGSTAEFSIMATGTGAITGGGSGTTTDAVSKHYEVAAGTYSVSETAMDGWMTVSNTCVDVAVAAGETETCTITNLKLPMITVTKMVVNDNTGTATSSDFTIHVHDMSGTTTVDVAGSPQPGSSVGSTYTVAPGPYHIQETGGPANYATVISGDCAADGSITLSAGDTKSCTVTNNDIEQAPTTGHLIVDKVTEPSGSTSVFDIMATGTGAITGGGTGTTTDAVSKHYEVMAGTYSVSETVPEGWIQKSNTCVDVAVDAGETETCTITNTKLATVTLTKVVVNDNGGTATSSDFTIHLHQMVGENMVDVDGSPQPGSASGTTYSNLALGDYHVADTGGPSGYSVSFSGDCNSDGTIAFAAGDSKSCTITNDDNPPQAEGKLLITEVMYDLLNDDSQGFESRNEWIELHNGMNSDVNLAGYFIHDALSADALPGITIPAGGFAIITGTSTTDSFWSIPGGVVRIVLGDTTIGSGLSNGDDRVWLENSASTTVDAVSWGEDTSAFSPAALDVAAGHSLARTPMTTDTDTAADWMDDATPTPGS